MNFTNFSQNCEYGFDCKKIDLNEKIDRLASYRSLAFLEEQLFLLGNLYLEHSDLKSLVILDLKLTEFLDVLDRARDQL